MMTTGLAATKDKLTPWQQQQQQQPFHCTDKQIDSVRLWYDMIRRRTGRFGT